jgi:DUF971 family protein
VEVVGNYAIALAWDDGHNTGIYAFDYLNGICKEYNGKSLETTDGRIKN